MVRFGKGIFKNNSRIVTLDGNSDIWAESLKRGFIKPKHIFREMQEAFQESVDPDYQGFAIDIFYTSEQN